MFSYTAAIEALDLHWAMQPGAAVRLVDVRSPAEYRAGHIRGAVSLPLDQLDRRRLAARLGPRAGVDETLYLISGSGARAEQAALRLRRLGMDRVALLAGGIAAWQSAGLPLARSAGLPSLEHQGQLIVGVLLLALVAKATLLHPVFYALIALLGVLLVAGALNRGPSLARFVARLPWNRPVPVARSAVQ